jgi:hypothetical protein
LSTLLSKGKIPHKIEWYDSVKDRFAHADIRQGQDLPAALHRILSESRPSPRALMPQRPASADGRRQRYSDVYYLCSGFSLKNLALLRELAAGGRIHIILVAEQERLAETDTAAASAQGIHLTVITPDTLDTPDNPDKMEQRSQGLTIEKPALDVAETPAAGRFFFYYLLMVLGLSSSYGCFYSAISVPANLPAALLCLTLFPLLFAVAFVTARPILRRTLLLSPLALGLIALLLPLGGQPYALAGKIANGFLYTTNRVIHAYAESTNFDFTLLPAPAADIDETILCGTLFTAALLFIFSLLMAWGFIRISSVFLCVLPTAFLTVTPLAYTVIPHYGIVAMYLLFLALLAFSESALWSGLHFMRRGYVPKGSMALRKTKIQAAHPAIFLVLPILVLCLLLESALFPAESFQRAAVFDGLRNGIANSTSLSALLQSGGVAGNTNRVNLQRAGSIRFTGKTVLRVNSTGQEHDYLKGFVGSVYTGGSWETLPDAARQKLDGISPAGRIQTAPSRFSALFSRLSLLRYGYYNPRFGRDDDQYAISVQNVGGNPRSIYMPYGLRPDEEWPGMQPVDDGFLKSGHGVFGTENYTLDTSRMEPLVQHHGSFYQLDPIIHSIGTAEDGSGTDEAEEDGMGGAIDTTQFMQIINDEAVSYALYYDSRLEWIFKTFPTFRELDAWKMDEWQKQDHNPAQAAFAAEMKEYTDFVYKYYTQLPADLKPRLDEFRDEYGLDKKHFYTADILADAIIDLVQGQNSYTLSPGPTPEGEDFVSYFLFENHRGYCMHFASAAVALLRSAGIPARYAEGYAVSPSDVRDSGGWASIPDSRAHAWVEIFVSGIGWMPLEATPGARNGILNHAAAAAATEGNAQNAQNADNSSGQSERPPATPSATTATPSAATPSAAAGMPHEATEAVTPSGAAAGGNGAGSGGAGNVIFRIPAWVFAAFASVALLLLALLFFRKRRLRLREARFAQKDYTAAAIFVYQHILDLLRQEKKGLGEPLAVVPEKDMPAAIYELALKARFSEQGLTKEELAALRTHADNLTARLKQSSPPPRRFLHKYVYWLY